MDKNTIRETVRMIASDQIVISVVGVTVSRVDTLESIEQGLVAWLTITWYWFWSCANVILLIVFLLCFFSTSFSFFDSFKNAFLFAGAFVLLNFVITFYIQNIKSRLLKDESLKTQEALGEGDIPIIAMIGVVLGVNSGIFAIFLAAFFAIIPSIYSNLVKKDIQTPFIPYLVLGFFTEYFFNLETFIKAFYWN